MVEKLSSGKNKSRALDIPITEQLIERIVGTRHGYRDNVEAFIEQELFIRDRESSDLETRLIPFKLAASQKSVLAHRKRVMDFNLRRSAMLHTIDPKARVTHLPVKVVYLKARKVYVSTIIQAIGFHQCEFYKGTNMLTIAHEKPAAENLAQISRTFDANWNRNTDPPIRKDIIRNSSELIEWDTDWDSRMIIQTAGGRGAGSARSFTLYFIHGSEISSYEDGSPQWANALQACASYCEVHAESTARGDNEFKKLWDDGMWLEEAERRLASNEPMPPRWNGYFRWFWAWWQDQDYRRALFPHERKHLEKTLEDDEKALVEEHALTLEQLQWRRDKINGDCSRQTEMAPKDYFKQEYPSNPKEAFIARGKKAYPPDVRMQLENLQQGSEAIYAAVARGDREGRKPVFFGHIARDKNLEEGWKLVASSYIEGASFVQWSLPDPRFSYAIGGDAAEGLEHGDDSAVSVWKRLGDGAREEAARYIGKADPEELGEMIYFLHVLYNGAFVAMERNKPGNATCLKLVALGCDNMYHHKPPEQFSDRDNPAAFTAGWLTSPSTKPLLVSAMITDIREGKVILYSREALKQHLAYENNDGKYSAPQGDKDDCVMADAIAGYCERSAPPPWVGLTEPEVEEDPFMMDTEEFQNSYWQSRVKELKRKCRERNSREEQIRTGFWGGEADEEEEESRALVRVLDA